MLRIGFSYKCGGTLLNEKRVVTAAHCVHSGRALVVEERIKIFLGMHEIDQFSNSLQLEVYKVVVHPEYEYLTLANDIAVIKLAQKAVYNQLVQPICLWPTDKLDISNILNKRGTVAGWGYTQYGELSSTLNKATLLVVDTYTCLISDRDFYGGLISEDNFCAGNNNGTNVCQGDSGSGFIFEMGGAWYLRGIVSLTKQAQDTDVKCDPKPYVIFLDVAQYLNWLRKYL